MPCMSHLPHWMHQLGTGGEGGPSFGSFGRAAQHGAQHGNGEGEGGATQRPLGNGGCGELRLGNTALENTATWAIGFFMVFPFGPVFDASWDRKCGGVFL